MNVVHPATFHLATWEQVRACPHSYEVCFYVCSKVDGYGFERPEDFDEQSYEEFMSTYLMVLARRATRWRPLVVGQEKVVKSRKRKCDLHKCEPGHDDQ